jgi:hypothetical protein
MRYAPSIDVGSADVHSARTILGEDRLVAASADIERRPEVAMAPVTVMAMMTMAVMHTVTVATMPTVSAMTTVPAAGRRRSNRSRGQRESRDSSERNLAKHSCSPFQA